MALFTSEGTDVSNKLALETEPEKGQGIKFIGVKSLERNSSPERKVYSIHFHVIVSSKEVADSLLSEWLEQCMPKEG